MLARGMIGLLKSARLVLKWTRSTLPRPSPVKSVVPLKTHHPALGTKTVPPPRLSAAFTAFCSGTELSCSTVAPLTVAVAAFASVNVVVPPPLTIEVARYPFCAVDGGVEGTYADAAGALKPQSVQSGSTPCATPSSEYE